MFVPSVFVLQCCSSPARGKGNILVSRWATTKFSLLILTFVCFATLSDTVLSQDLPQVIRVGAYHNSPKIYLDPRGNAVGFWPDLLANIALKEKWNIQYVPGSWQECLDRLSAGEIDIMPDVIFTESRSHLYTFSETTVIMSWTRLYVHQDNLGFHTVRDLDGWTVAVLAVQTHTAYCHFPVYVWNHHCDIPHPGQANNPGIETPQ